MTDAIRVTNQIDIDWYALGQYLASLQSDQQGAFMDGFGGGLHALGPAPAAYQIGFIAESVHGYTGWLAQELTDALNGGTE